MCLTQGFKRPRRNQALSHRDASSLNSCPASQGILQASPNSVSKPRGVGGRALRKGSTNVPQFRYVWEI